MHGGIAREPRSSVLPSIVKLSLGPGAAAERRRGDSPAHRAGDPRRYAKDESKASKGDGLARADLLPRGTLRGGGDKGAGEMLDCVDVSGRVLGQVGCCARLYSRLMRALMLQ